MFSRWKITVVTALFVVGAVSFLLGLFPALAAFFWILWFAGCGACILGLILAVVIPTYYGDRQRLRGTDPKDLSRS